jgi:hypothetical protein
MRYAIILFMFISINWLPTLSTSAQEPIICDEAFLQHQTGLIDLHAQTYAENDEAKTAYQQRAQRDLAEFCQVPLEGRLLLGHTEVPIEAWVIAEVTNGAFDADAERYGVDGSCVIGYLYIDHDAGTSLYIESFCTILEDGTIQYTVSPSSDGTVLIVRYDVLKDFDIAALTAAQLQALNIPIRPFWADIYQTEVQYTLRRNRELDSLRYPGFPDDINVIIFPADIEVELEEVWGRLIQQQGPTQYLVQILDEPEQDLGFHQGDQLSVELYENDNIMYAVYYIE